MEKIFKICTSCQGTGTTPGSAGLLCPQCDGIKIQEWGNTDTIKLDAIIATQALHTEALDYIHGKVTAIWNQVKPRD